MIGWGLADYGLDMREQRAMRDINDLSLPEVEKQIVFTEGLLIVAWQKFADQPAAAGRNDAYLAETDSIRAALFMLYGRRMVLKPTEH